MSTISGSTVSLYQAGNPPTLLATTTTNKDGTFNFTAPSSASGLLYIVVTGGNAGSGTNSNIQLMALAGTASSPTRTLIANELTSAAAQTVGMNMGLLIDSGGTISLAAAANQTGANNVITQYGNLLVSTTGQLNTSNSNLSTAMQNALNTMANAFASCIESASGCSSLMSTATGTSGSAAANILESGFNMLSNSSTVASGIYTIAAAMRNSTGFSIPATIPGGFSFNNTLPTTTNTFTVGTFPEGIAIDASGNVWIVNNNSGNVMKLSASGIVLATVTVGSSPHDAAIDSAGNVWVPNSASATITEISSAGTVLGNFSTGTNPYGVAIDSAGNVWVDTAATNSSTSGVVELSSSGTTLKTFNYNIPVSGNFGFRAIAFDASGNLWVAHTINNTVYEINPSNGGIITSVTVGHSPTFIQFDPSGNMWVANYGSSTGTVNKLNSLGAVLGTFLIGNANGEGLAIDASGNVWVGSSTMGSVEELSSSGTLLATYTGGGIGAFCIALDPSGNLWASNLTGGTVTKISALTIGPQFFPYSGPQFAQGSY